MLRVVELPAYGGDTCWANMYAVYESLSPAIQRALEGLQAEHDYMKISYTTAPKAAPRAGCMLLTPRLSRGALPAVLAGGGFLAASGRSTMLAGGCASSVTG